MAKTKAPASDLPFKVTSSRAIPRDRALLISGPLKIKATPELREYFAECGEHGVELVGDRIEFASFEHAAAGLAIAGFSGVITTDQANDLIREAAEELRDKRAVLVKNISKGESDDDERRSDGQR
jgi:hypothetical protein